MESFGKLGLCEPILKVVREKGFDSPTEVQEKTIPLILKGSDVIAGSATGSGKTLAFGSGIIENVKKGKGVQALILTPTRELCEQVSKALEDFSRYVELKYVSVYGGVSINNQIKKLSHADVVVATPGRLLDHLQRKSVTLENVSYLVLDEADRMWDMGFKDDVAKIVRKCSEKRQTMLFSATISPELADFSEKYMKNPVEVSVEAYVDASKLKQIYYDVRDNEKFSLLIHLLKNEKSNVVMIFSNTRRNADLVYKKLKTNKINEEVIQGGMVQNKRNRVMKNFSKGPNFLVCTDVAARGLHIEGVSHVYNYDLPKDAKDFIHRIGRTARAGKEGIAINLVASRDYDNFSNIQKRYPNISVKREMTPHFDKIFADWGSSRNKRPRGNFGKNFNRNSGGRFGKKQGGRSFGRSDSKGERKDSGSGRSFREKSYFRGNSTFRNRDSKDGGRRNNISGNNFRKDGENSGRNRNDRNEGRRDFRKRRGFGGNRERFREERRSQ